MTDKYTIIKNVKYIDVAARKSVTCDVFLGERSHEGRRLVTTGKTHGNDRFVPANSEEEIFLAMYDGLTIQNARGKHFSPAFVDISCRLGIGPPAGEDFFNSTASARLGGWGVIAPAPEKSTPADTSPYCRMIPVASLRKAVENSLAGVSIVSDLCDPYLPNNDLRNIMKYCAGENILFIAGRMDDGIVGDGKVNLGRASKMLRTPGIAPSAENVAVSRAIVLAAETECRLHIPVVSTAASVDIIRAAKSAGIAVTCGTTPTHFALCDDDVVLHGASAVVYPPLRGKDDRAAIIAGLADGTIDCISSGHSPASGKDKEGRINDVAFGAIGFETAFSLCVTYLLRPKHIDIYRLIQLLSHSPAEILGVDTTLKQGEFVRANLISLDSETIYTHSNLRTRCANTPFYGRPLWGTVDEVY